MDERSPEIKYKYPELSKNENTINQNLWDAAKVMLREKFITFNVHVIKVERSII